MSFKFNPMTGKLDIFVQNFSFNYVEVGRTLFVPQYQQMVVEGHLDVHGDLDLVGDLSTI